jgi:hypothetical protein
MNILQKSCPKTRSGTNEVFKTIIRPHQIGPPKKLWHPQQIKGGQHIRRHNIISEELDKSSEMNGQKSHTETSFSVPT